MYISADEVGERGRGGRRGASVSLRVHVKERTLKTRHFLQRVVASNTTCLYATSILSDFFISRPQQKRRHLSVADPGSGAFLTPGSGIRDE